MSLRDQLLRDAAETPAELDQFGLVPVDLLMECRNLTKEEAIVSWQASFRAKYPVKDTSTGLKAQLLGEIDELSHLSEDPMATQVDVDLSDLEIDGPAGPEEPPQPKMIIRKGDLLKTNDLSALLDGVTGSVVVDHHGPVAGSPQYLQVSFQAGDIRVCSRFLIEYTPPKGLCASVKAVRNGRYVDVVCTYTKEETLEGNDLPF